MSTPLEAYQSSFTNPRDPRLAPYLSRTRRVFPSGHSSFPLLQCGFGL
jgi:hypothetical protein